MINWEAIQDEWETTDISFTDLAEKYSVKDGTIRARKKRESWKRKKVTKKVTKKKEPVTLPKKEPLQKKEVVEEPKEPELHEAFDFEFDPTLNERMKDFCLHYLKSHNATQSAINAGYSPAGAHVQGHVLLNNPKIQKQLKALKGAMRRDIYVDALDVINQYVKIAFSDIRDFAWFGKRTVDVVGSFGPVIDESTGKPFQKEVNFVDFKDSELVDGSIITEVKQGKDGITVKLADKMEAMKFLREFFDLAPDNFKRQHAEEQLKLQYRRLKDEDGADHYEDDGFKEALEGKVEGVWDDAAVKAATEETAAD